jgi:hypothetical protein
VSSAASAAETRAAERSSAESGVPASEAAAAEATGEGGLSVKESLRTPSSRAGVALGAAANAAAAWRAAEAAAAAEAEAAPLPLRRENRAREAGVAFICRCCCCCCLLLPSAAALDAEALSSRRRSTVPASARAADSGSVERGRVWRWRSKWESDEQTNERRRRTDELLSSSLSFFLFLHTFYSPVGSGVVSGADMRAPLELWIGLFGVDCNEKGRGVSWVGGHLVFSFRESPVVFFFPAMLFFDLAEELVRAAFKLLFAALRLLSIVESTKPWGTKQFDTERAPRKRRRKTLAEWFRARRRSSSISTSNVAAPFAFLSLPLLIPPRRWLWREGR